MPEAEREALLAALQKDWRTAGLAPTELALCAFAEKLTLAPRDMREADIQALRSAGFSDAAIHEATQIASYFNYINRVADTLSVALEPEMPPPA